MRLAPGCRRYLETILWLRVVGQTVFLRGIFFTSSMREAGRSTKRWRWRQPVPRSAPGGPHLGANRAYFLRDLFHEKSLRESGLVTRATNTLKLLRHRQLAIFGSAGVALLILLIFADSLSQPEKERSRRSGELANRRHKPDQERMVHPHRRPGRVLPFPL